MTNPALSDWRLTFDHANQHLGHLERSINRFVERPVYRGVRERDVNSGQYIIRSKLRRNIPPDIQLLLQDTLTSYRFSLDQLAHALRGDSFPICATEDEFYGTSSASTNTRAAAYKIRRVDPEVFANIEALQPYYGGKDYKVSPLWLLNKLRNRAYRNLHVVLARAHHAALVIGGGEHFEFGNIRGTVWRGISLRAGVIDDNTQIASFAPGLNRASEPKVKVQINGPFAVTFDPEGPATGRPVLDILNEIGVEILNKIFPTIEVYA